MKAIIFDIDGTLADVEHRLHHLPNWDKFFADMDKDPIIPEIQWINQAFNEMDDVAILVVSARPNDYIRVTETWLHENHIYYDNLYMRNSGDYRKDSIVKAEILQKILDDGYEPFIVIDDREEVVGMWRSYGICTLQCAASEPKAHHLGKIFLDILVGPSGAGKSTFAKANYKEHDILSTDQLREQYGWGHSPEDLKKTWNYAHGLIKTRLENHIFTVFDATNLKKKDRASVLACVPKGQYVRYIVIDRPYIDKSRDKGWRPEELILKHDKTFRGQLKDILNGDGLPNVTVIDKRN